MPYVYTVPVGETTLTVFGADHSNDRHHSQFERLAALFEQPPHCVLLEGLQDELLFRQLHQLVAAYTPEEAIEEGGEAVFAAQLACAAGSTWQSIEPDDQALFSYLEQLGFPRKNILGWALLRLLPSISVGRNSSLPGLLRTFWPSWPERLAGLKLIFLLRCYSRKRLGAWPTGAVSQRSGGRCLHFTTSGRWGLYDLQHHCGGGH